jgi:hypothetical protein
MFLMAQNFLLHPAFNHAPNALVPPPSTAIGDINNDEQQPTRWYRPEWNNEVESVIDIGGDLRINWIVIQEMKLLIFNVTTMQGMRFNWSRLMELWQ